MRHAEHKKCASDALSSSFFYLVFPLKDSIRASKRDRRGIFESLEQVVAAGFDSKSEAAKHVNRDCKEGGVLILNEEEKKSIKLSMKNLKCSELEKFHNILAYQIELGYDLALSPDNNVSKSPGFESVLGVTSSS